MPANHASRILVEPLEQRRLLAAAISANEDLLVFNDRVGGGYSPTQGVIITNTGSDPLIIPVGGIRLRGAHPQNFLVTYHPALGATIAPGESVQVRAAFKASGLGIRHAQLQIESNDPDAPLTAISLRGLGTKGLFGNDEPPLQWVLDVHDIPVDVGDPDLSTPIIDQPQETGEQMAVPFLRKAGPGPVSIEMLGLFSSAANPAGRFGYYTTGGGPLNELFVVHGDDVQSVNPRTIGTTSFDPGEATFGLFSTWPNEPGRVVFSHDERNTWAHPGDRQKYRFYPMRNRDGSIELNALVVGIEEAANGDYQDAVFVIRNVKPNVAPADPTGIVAQAISATSIRVTWNDNASNEYGYLIERSRTKDGTYMALATTPVNAQEFVDMALRPDTRYYYRVRALSAAGNSHHTGRTSDRTLVPGVSGSLQTNFSEDPVDRYLLLDELA